MYNFYIKTSNYTTGELRIFRLKLEDIFYESKYGKRPMNKWISQAITDIEAELDCRAYHAIAEEEAKIRQLGKILIKRYRHGKSKYVPDYNDPEGRSIALELLGDLEYYKQQKENEIWQNWDDEMSEQYSQWF